MILSYGMIRWKQANMGFKDWGLTYGNPDFVKYAESYGAKGHRVTSAEGLAPLLASVSTHRACTSSTVRWTIRTTTRFLTATLKLSSKV